MTPHNRAVDLFIKVQSVDRSVKKGKIIQWAKLIAEEISDVLWDQMADTEMIIYWEDVKNEIEKL